MIPRDEAIPDSIRAQRPLLLEYPSAPASRAFAHVAETIDERFVEMRVKGGVQFFFEQLLEVSGGIDS
jgi:MinD-like ATPase involved in chromosome partitioning or flagellar assembly